MYFTNQKNMWRIQPLVHAKQINLKVEVAKHAANLMWGGGYDLVSTSDSDEALLKEIETYNGFNELFYTNEMDLSQRGNLFATVEMVKGKPAIITDDPMMISSVGYSFVEKEVAVIYKNVYIDARPYPIKEIWDREKVQRYWVDGGGHVILVDAMVKKVPKAEQVPLVWYHNLGYVPVVHFKNRPGAHRMYSVPDDFNTGCLNKYYNDSLQTLNEVEVKNNVTKIYARMDKKDKKQLKREADAAGMSVKEYFQRTQNMIVQTDFTGDKSGDAAKGTIQAIQGKLPAKEWHSHLKNTRKQFFELSGYSQPDPDKESGIGGSSGLDVIFTNKQDVETTRAKLHTRQDEYNEMLKIIKDMVNKHGIGFISGDLTLDIKTALALDSTGEVDKSAKKLEMGTSSRVREIMKLERVSRKEAEDIIAEANADAEFKASMESEKTTEAADKEGAE